MTEQEFVQEYARLGHAIQSGVALEHAMGSRDGESKQLRTGLNLAMSDIGSLGRLFVKKGLITEAEYFESILDGLRKELAEYEEKYGVKFA